jgi:hypothetical protein
MRGYRQDVGNNTPTVKPMIHFFRLNKTAFPYLEERPV